MLHIVIPPCGQDPLATHQMPREADRSSPRETWSPCGNADAIH